VVPWHGTERTTVHHESATRVDPCDRPGPSPAWSVGSGHPHTPDHVRVDRRSCSPIDTPCVTTEPFRGFSPRTVFPSYAVPGGMRKVEMRNGRVVDAEADTDDTDSNDEAPDKDDEEGDTS